MGSWTQCIFAQQPHIARIDKQRRLEHTGELEAELYAAFQTDVSNIVERLQCSGVAEGSRTQGTRLPRPDTVGPTRKEALLKGQHLEVAIRNTDARVHPHRYRIEFVDAAVEAEVLLELDVLCVLDSKQTVTARAVCCGAQHIAQAAQSIAGQFQRGSAVVVLALALIALRVGEDASAPGHNQVVVVRGIEEVIVEVVEDLLEGFGFGDVDLGYLEYIPEDLTANLGVLHPVVPVPDLPQAALVICAQLVVERAGQFGLWIGAATHLVTGQREESVQFKCCFRSDLKSVESQCISHVLRHISTNLCSGQQRLGFESKSDATLQALRSRKQVLVTVGKIGLHPQVSVPMCASRFQRNGVLVCRVQVDVYVQFGDRSIQDLFKAHVDRVVQVEFQEPSIGAVDARFGVHVSRRKAQSAVNEFRIAGRRLVEVEVYLAIAQGVLSVVLGIGELVVGVDVDVSDVELAVRDFYNDIGVLRALHWNAAQHHIEVHFASADGAIGFKGYKVLDKPVVPVTGEVFGQPVALIVKRIHIEAHPFGELGFTHELGQPCSQE